MNLSRGLDKLAASVARALRLSRRLDKPAASVARAPEFVQASGQTDRIYDAW